MPLRGWLCLLLTCLPALYCGLADVNSWPFSNFPMYSAPLQLSSFRQHLVFVVPKNGEPIEVRSRETLWPLNSQRLPVRARQLLALPDGRQRVTDLLNYYSRRVVQQYRKTGSPAPVKLQLRFCQGDYVISGNQLNRATESEQVVVSVDTWQR